LRQNKDERNAKSLNGISVTLGIYFLTLDWKAAGYNVQKPQVYDHTKADDFTFL